MLLFTSFSAPSDYEEIGVNLIFTADELGIRENCTSIIIVFDQLVEEIERFTVVINSSDASVLIGRDNSSITLFDSSGKEARTYNLERFTNLICIDDFIHSC